MVAPSLNRKLNPESPEGLKTCTIRDIGNHFREGITKLPWTITQLSLLGFLIYLLAGTHPGNWIRCHLFDANGCAPRVILTIEAADITSEILLKKEKDYRKMTKTWPINWDEFLIKEFILKVSNIGVQSIRQITLTPSIILDNKEEGLMLLYKVDGSSELEQLNGHRIKLSGRDFREMSIWTKEGATLRLVGAIKKVKGKASKPQLSVEMECLDCQVKLEKTSFR